MCGVFGYFTKTGRGPDLDRLRRIAVETQRRGHHAFGLAWLGDDEAIQTYKRPGPATANLGDLDACRDAAVVVGHCRWATHGSPHDNRNNHPHPAGRGWLVHNGVVTNHEWLARRYRLPMATQCDSEVLGLLMARFAGSVLKRAARTAEAAAGRLVLLGIWTKPARLLLVRNGNPLYFGETRDGFYFGSLPDQLPGRPLAFRDRHAGLITRRGDESWYDDQPLR